MNINAWYKSILDPTKVEVAPGSVRARMYSVGDDVCGVTDRQPFSCTSWGIFAIVWELATMRQATYWAQILNVVPFAAGFTTPPFPPVCLGNTYHFKSFDTSTYSPNTSLWGSPDVTIPGFAFPLTPDGWHLISSSTYWIITKAVACEAFPVAGLPCTNWLDTTGTGSLPGFLSSVNAELADVPALLLPPGGGVSTTRWFMQAGNVYGT